MPTKIITVFIILIILLGGGYYFLNLRGKSPQTSTENKAMTLGESAPSGQSFAGSLTDLLTLGQNYSCTFQTTDDSGAQTSGLVFVSAGGDKLSGEFEMTDTDGAIITSSVVRDGEYNYMWSSALDQGFKYKIGPDDESIFGQEGDQSNESVGIDENANMDFNCQPWVVDNSKFVPPVNIEFVEFTAPNLETLPDATEDTPNCSVCNQVPEGTSRNQCLTALGC